MKTREPQPVIPIAIVKLIVGFFSNTNTDEQRDALDEWITENDDNMQVFTECVEIEGRPVRRDLEAEEEEEEVSYLLSLVLKHLQKTIIPEEKEDLDDWLSHSEQNRKLFNEMPETSDEEILYSWMLEKCRELKRQEKLN